MACPLFCEGQRVRCEAIAADVPPTIRERELYCRAPSYVDCPTLLTMLRLGRPLSEEEYLALWLPAE